MSPQHLRRLANSSACAIGPLAITVFERSPSHDEGLEAMRVLSEVAASHEKLKLLCVIAEGCGVPDASLRDLLTREVKRVQKQIGAVANVVEGEGFAAAALRSAVTGMTLVLRPAYPVKTYATVDEAALFLGRDGATRWDEIAAAVARIRAS